MIFKKFWSECFSISRKSEEVFPSYWQYNYEQKTAFVLSWQSSVYITLSRRATLYSVVKTVKLLITISVVPRNIFSRFLAVSGHEKKEIYKQCTLLQRVNNRINWCNIFYIKQIYRITNIKENIFFSYFFYISD